jgi:hypothetical protein
MVHTRGIVFGALFATLAVNANPRPGSSSPQLHRLKLQREKPLDGAQLASLEEESGQVVFDPRFEMEILANKYGGASKIGFGGESLPFDKAENVQAILDDDEGGGYSTPLQSKQYSFFIYGLS